MPQRQQLAVVGAPVMRRIFRLGLTGLLLTGGIHAGTAASLEDALREAYLANPRLEAERARLRATDELVPQALSGWRPLLRATGSYTINRRTEDDEADARRTFEGSIDNESDRQTDILYQPDFRLLAQQPVYSGGETVAGTARAESQVLAARARLTDVEQSVLFDVISAYAGVVRARNVLRLSQANLDRLERYRSGTLERFRVAEVTRTDLSQADSRVAGAIADLARAESELEAAMADYERVVGQPPGTLEAIGPAAELPASPAEAEALAPNHPRIVQAGFDLDAARSQVRVDEAQLLPEINVIGEIIRRTQPSNDLQSITDAAIGAELVVPLYQRGTEYSRVRQAKQTAVQRRYDLTDIERAVRREIVTSFEALRAARQQVGALGEQVAAAQAALEGVREEAIVGSRTVLDVLNAEQELFVAQVRRERAATEEIEASYRLRAAVGRLTLADLGVEAPRYDAEANYRRVRNRWFGLGIDQDVYAAPSR
jgi:outer membrane protein